MDKLKRIAGIVWMVMGPVALYYLITMALAEVERKPVLDTKIQWGVFVGVFTPIAIGLTVFGWYAFKGEYDRLPESSDDI